jgi:hypothetical protein
MHHTEFVFDTPFFCPFRRRMATPRRLSGFAGFAIRHTAKTAYVVADEYQVEESMVAATVSLTTLLSGRVAAGVALCAELTRGLTIADARERA